MQRPNLGSMMLPIPRCSVLVFVVTTVSDTASTSAPWTLHARSQLSNLPFVFALCSLRAVLPSAKLASRSLCSHRRQAGLLQPVLCAHLVRTMWRRLVRRVREEVARRSLAEWIVEAPMQAIMLGGFVRSCDPQNCRRVRPCLLTGQKALLCVDPLSYGVTKGRRCAS
jgi:hypothetical protein